jgi:hypothetical protein
MPTIPTTTPPPRVRDVIFVVLVRLQDPETLEYSYVPENPTEIVIQLPDSSWEDFLSIRSWLDRLFAAGYHTNLPARFNGRPFTHTEFILAAVWPPRGRNGNGNGRRIREVSAPIEEVRDDLDFLGWIDRTLDLPFSANDRAKPEHLACIIPIDTETLPRLLQPGEPTPPPAANSAAEPPTEIPADPVHTPTPEVEDHGAFHYMAIDFDSDGDANENASQDSGFFDEA